MLLRRDFIRLCGAGALAGALPSTVAVAAEGANMGAIEPFLLQGEQPPWSGGFENGLYRLRNTTGFNSVLHFTAGAPEGVKSVSIDVLAVGNGAYCGAGLLLNRETNDGGWLAVALQPGGALGLYVRDQTGLNRVTELAAVGLRIDVMTRLSVENSASGIDILTNGQKCGSFSDLRLKGACGAVAFDIGDFYFANFAMG